MRLSESQRASLEQATARYSAQLDDQCLTYLEGRGLTADVADTFRLGRVVDPLPEHEGYRGRLVIPYLTRAGVVNLRFRCIDPHDCKEQKCPKYLGPAGADTNLFNVSDLFTSSPFVAITEGEIDAIVLSARIGIPAVGCPGVKAWKEHYPRCFAGFDPVLVFADGDEAGKDFGRRLLGQLDTARTVVMPDGMDVNEMFLSMGGDAVKVRAGV